MQEGLHIGGVQDRQNGAMKNNRGQTGTEKRQTLYARALLQLGARQGKGCRVSHHGRISDIQSVPDNNWVTRQRYAPS